MITLILSIILVVIIILLFQRCKFTCSSLGNELFGQDPSIRASVGWLAGPHYGYDPIDHFAKQIYNLRMSRASKYGCEDVCHTRNDHCEECIRDGMLSEYEKSSNNKEGIKAFSSRKRSGLDSEGIKAFSSRKRSGLDSEGIKAFSSRKRSGLDSEGIKLNIFSNYPNLISSPLPGIGPEPEELSEDYKEGHHPYILQDVIDEVRRDTQGCKSCG